MIFKKRGQWCFYDERGIIRKFSSEIEAKLALGSAPQTEIEDEEGAILQYQPEEEEGYQSFEEEIDD
jgi:hypothetical protein